MKILFTIKPRIKFSFIKTKQELLIEFLCFVLIIKTKQKYSWEYSNNKNCFVLSSSKEEYLKWCVNTSRSPKQYKYVENENYLLLKLDECDEIYLVGGYKLESLELINRLSSKVNCVISRL